jgi:hypothetical protein
MCFSGTGNYIWMQFFSRGSSFARLDSNLVPPPRGNKIHFKVGCDNHGAKSRQHKNVESPCQWDGRGHVKRGAQKPKLFPRTGGNFRKFPSPIYIADIFASPKHSTHHV